MRCLHLDRSGRQCPSEAMEGRDFCEDHYQLLDSLPGAEPSEERSRRPYIYQLAAFILLLIFLANFYQTILQMLGR